MTPLAPASHRLPVVTLLVSLTLIGGYCYQLLRPRVGAATAWAGISVTYAVIVTLWYVVTGTCGQQGTDCTVPDVAGRVLVWAVLPLAVAVAVVLPYQAFRLVWACSKALTARVRSARRSQKGS